MANNLNEEQRKWILKKYWKYENAETVRKVWQEAFHTPPPSRLTIYRLRNKLTDYIHDAFREIDEDRNLCRTVCQSVLDRCEECCNVGGGHFEHLRD